MNKEEKKEIKYKSLARNFMDVLMGPGIGDTWRYGKTEILDVPLFLEKIEESVYHLLASQDQKEGKDMYFIRFTYIDADLDKDFTKHTTSEILQCDGISHLTDVIERIEAHMKTHYEIDAANIDILNITKL